MPRIDSYLSIDEVLAAAERTGAEAIHPGYGFLAENPLFAARCEQAGRRLHRPVERGHPGDGRQDRREGGRRRARVPTVPGAGEPGMTDEQLIAAAAGVGYPLLIKPSAGGGGKGMHVVAPPRSSPPALAAARREAAASFGDDTLLLERYLASPRHIEVQVMADRHGHVIHLGERDCTLQRRHQKVIEEAPSALLGRDPRAAGRGRLRDRAIGRLLRAGTVEFIVVERRARTSSSSWR